MGVSEGGGYFLDTHIGGPVAVKKGPSLLTRKKFYSQLYEANGANRTIKGTLESPKRLCKINLMKTII